MNQAPPTQASIAEAKNHLPRLVQQVESGEPVSITRRGHPVAVLLSAEAYARLIAPRPDLGDFLSHWRAEVMAEGVADEEVFNTVRDNSPGREADFD